MKSVIVLGLGKFGKSVAQTLYELDYEVLGVDTDEKIVNDFSRHITQAVQADITSEEFLKSMDIEKFDAAIVAVGSNIQVGIMVTVLLKELGAKFILVKTQDDFQEKILYKLGADKVILPEKDIGIKVARNLATDNFYEMIEISPDYSIISVTTPASWIGKTLGNLAVRSRYGINILAVKGSNNTNIIPDANTVIESGTIVTIMGMNTDLKRFRNVK
ncbi:MAG: TrkA family potassium uptake protein [Anaerocolumna sp.]